MLFNVELRTWSFIIGYIVLVTRFLKLLYNTVTMVPIVMVVEEINRLNEGSEVKYLKSVATIICLEMFISFLDIISTISLIIGLHKKNRKLVYVFLVTTTIYFILGVILIMFGASISARMYMAADWFRFGCEFIYKCVYVYCVYVIRRYYIVMRLREEGCCAYDNFTEISKPD